MERIALTNRLSPELKIALLFFQNLQPKEPFKLEAFISSWLAKIKSGLSAEAESNRLFNRRLYSHFHLDPTRERPSAEKLWRRIKRGEEFPRIHSLLDLVNLLSVCWQVLYGVYDARKIYPPLEVRLGKDDDAYLSVGNQQLRLGGKIVLVDQRGAFGNPTADSRRAAIDLNSKDFLVAIYGSQFQGHFDSWVEQTREKINTFFSFSKVWQWPE